MKSKLKWAAVVGCIVGAFSFGVISPDSVMIYARYSVSYVLMKVFGTKPLGPSTANAQVCRENLHRIQAAKRKAAQDRGNPIGAITWEEVLRAMYPGKPLRPEVINAFVPKCPDGGTYSVGTLEEVPRCSVGGNNTVTIQDDHIIRD